MDKKRIGHPFQTTKLWEETLAKLRRIYAITGESQASIVDRLVEWELDKLGEAWDGRPEAAAKTKKSE